MNLSFLQNDPLNTVIVNSADGAVMYATETHKLVNSATTIKRMVPGVEGGQTIAEIHWGTLTFRSPRVKYRGEELRTSDFLLKESLFSRFALIISCKSDSEILCRSRTFIAGDRKEYKWKCDGPKKFEVSLWLWPIELPGHSFSELQLFDPAKNLLVESHKEHFGIFHKASQYNLDITASGMHMLDDIIVSFVVMKHEEDLRQKSVSVTGAGVS